MPIHGQSNHNALAGSQTNSTILKGSAFLGLILHPSSSLDIPAYTNADWASRLDDQRSTTGYCIFLGSNLVSQSSTKQKVMSRSSAKSEYCALAAIVAEVTWI